AGTEAVDRARVRAERARRELRGRQRLGIEARRQLGPRRGRLTLRVESQVQAVAQEVDRRLPARREREGRLPILDLLDARPAAVAPHPCFEERRHRREVTGVLLLQAREVVVVLAPGDQLLERLPAIERQREPLGEPGRLSVETTREGRDDGR